MNKLIVFETNKEESDFALANGEGDINVALGSLQRGAGSIGTKGMKHFDLVVFIRGDYFEGDYSEYTDKMECFIKDLKMYDLTNEATKFI